jgi:hypothetical protein
MIEQANPYGYPGDSWIDSQLSIMTNGVSSGEQSPFFTSSRVDVFPSIDAESTGQVGSTFQTLGSRPTFIIPPPLDFRPWKPSIQNVLTIDDGTPTQPAAQPSSLSPIVVTLAALALAYLIAK